MQPDSRHFKANAEAALREPRLQAALKQLELGFVAGRQRCYEALPEFESLRDRARDILDHTLENLDAYLLEYESRVIASGGQVHWASTPQQARAIVIDICRAAKARTVIRGKSMVGEEIGINDALEAAGFEVTETDLGEYILQLAEEPPSHIVAPAIHKTKEEISDLFFEHHRKLGFTQRQTDRGALVAEARQVLREKFLGADVGMTGANFLIAETGSNVIVTNEGNGDLSSTLPRVQIVTAAIDKVVPTLEDASLLLRLLGRSATGQEITAYTTFTTGPKRAGDADGPDEYHVVLIDNHRSEMLGSELRPMLRCIRCGACMNHCPVYGRVGGHAYGWVYPGPMGSVLTPIMVGLDEAGHLPNACTLNGRCETVCPVKIPLPTLLRSLRSRQHLQRQNSRLARIALSLWTWVALRPRLYQALTRPAMSLLSQLGAKSGSFRRMPLASGWTRVRDLPAPQGSTFQARWQQQQRGRK
ncbi:MAG: LutB/LldF family L-lactate oxidation iron-sulfur protein [Gammaproteobacteria bacterium]|nr:LutB/LldF family L-lactate oxidation iron-sulfur protein [Gammaproteobacteria bacterium]MDH3449246.1 LutB/LldF family L-lactate oxidation iron-sulfur protein [Gammaproteobacteria bacterium]